MPYNRITQLGDGSTNTFTVNFPLGKIANVPTSQFTITCRVGGEPTDRTITWVSDNIAEISGAAPGIGIPVVFTRIVTKTELISDFENDAILIDTALNNASKQAIIIAMDTLDGNIGPLSTDLDMNGYKILNLASGTDPTDGANIQNVIDIATELAETIPIGPPGPPGSVNLNTVDDMEAQTIDADVTAVIVSGTSADGDGGRALYSRAGSEPSHAGKFQSADGAWWEIEKREIWVDQFIQNEASGADKRAAIERAASRLGSAGGIIRTTPGVDYNISGLDLPPLCVIQGPYDHIDTYADGVTYTGHGTFRNHRGLVLASTGTINTYGSAGLVNCFVRRSGWVYTDALPTNYAGIMMTSQAYAPILKNVMGIGFGSLLKTGQHPRVYIDKLYGDPLNGLDMDRAADVTRIRDVHLWPFGTIEGYVAAGATNENSLLRSGTALKWRNGAAGSLVDGFFSLGYNKGIDLGTLSTLQIGRIRCELPPDANAGSVGFTVGSAVDAVHVGSIYMSGYEKGLQINTTANTRIDIGFMEMHLGSGTVAEILSGDVTIGQGFSWNRNGILFDIQNTASHVHVGDWYHRNSGGTITDYVKVPVNGRTDRIKVNLRNEQAAGGSIISGGPLIFPGVADSAGVMNLAPQSNEVATGSAADLVTINGGWTGREITILCQSARNLANTGNILQTPATLAIPAGTLLKFKYNGTHWVRL